MHPTYQRIISLLNLDKVKDKKFKIVDYGCGSGLLLKYLPKEMIFDYSGFDINENSIKEAKKTYFSRNIHFYLINKDKNRFEQARSVDAIVLVGVLQYLSISEIDWLLTQSKKILKKNGFLIISCAVGHWPYRLFNLYRLFLPNKFINKKLFINKIKNKGFKISFCEEKGILLAPLFSNILVLVFDSLDKLIFKTQSKLGPIGSVSRKIINPLLTLEYLLPINYGYTLFMTLNKNE